MEKNIKSEVDKQIEKQRKLDKANDLSNMMPRGQGYKRGEFFQEDQY